jgi:hypothetical protein
MRRRSEEGAMHETRKRARHTEYIDLPASAQAPLATLARERASIR